MILDLCSLPSLGWACRAFRSLPRNACKQTKRGGPTSLTTALEGHGLALDGLIAASEDDWDRYASASWRAARSWAAANPEDPDRAEILSMTDGFRRRHLRFTRPHLGWAILVARRAVEESGV